MTTRRGAWRAGTDSATNRRVPARSSDAGVELFRLSVGSTGCQESIGQIDGTNHWTNGGRHLTAASFTLQSNINRRAGSWEVPVRHQRPRERGMQVIRADHLGMCFGVRDAIALAVERAATTPLTILGDLVHNEAVLADLRSRGMEI